MVEIRIAIVLIHSLEIGPDIDAQELERLRRSWRPQPKVRLVRQVPQLSGFLEALTRNGVHGSASLLTQSNGPTNHTDVTVVMPSRRREVVSKKAFSGCPYDRVTLCEDHRRSLLYLWIGEELSEPGRARPQIHDEELPVLLVRGDIDHVTQITK